MGCNCGKNKKTRPFGMGATTTTTTKREESYVLRTSTGTQTFGSKLEAEAAKRRAGGGSITKRF